MNIDFINGFLCAIADMGHGLNHGNDFHCCEIQYENTLKESLEKYYNEQVYSYSAGSKEPNRGGWEISIKQNIEVKQFKSKLSYYFFEMEFSPSLCGDGNGVNKSDYVDYFIEYLSKVYESKFRIHSINVHSRLVFYDAVYDDFVVDFGKRYLLIHLGFSD